MDAQASRLSPIGFRGSAGVLVLEMTASDGGTVWRPADLLMSGPVERMGPRSIDEPSRTADRVLPQPDSPPGQVSPRWMSKLTPRPLDLATVRSDAATDRELLTRSRTLHRAPPWPVRCLLLGAWARGHARRPSRSPRGIIRRRVFVDPARTRASVTGSREVDLGRMTTSRRCWSDSAGEPAALVQS